MFQCYAFSSVCVAEDSNHSVVKAATKSEKNGEILHISEETASRFEKTYSWERELDQPLYHEKVESELSMIRSIPKTHLSHPSASYTIRRNAFHVV